LIIANRKPSKEPGNAAATDIDCGGKRDDEDRRMRVAPRAHTSRDAVPAVLLAALLCLAGCAGPTITEDSPTAVTVRYDGVVHRIDDATALAQRACARRGKTARLRRIGYEGLGAGLRFAHFDCL
jgi:hypothetical protein